MKGRKPKDLAMKILSGNAGKRPLNRSPLDKSPIDSREPFFAGEIEKPAGLDAWASEEWDRLVERLAPILSPASGGMLLVACSAYAQLMKADEIIQEKGFTYETNGEAGTVIRMRPEVRIRDAARTAYHRALTELGASPVAHSRVKKLPDGNQEELPGISRFFS
jgi:P27 family predicted phage terminase small subunit